MNDQPETPAVAPRHVDGAAQRMVEEVLAPVPPERQQDRRKEGSNKANGGNDGKTRILVNPEPPPDVEGERQRHRQQLLDFSPTGPCEVVTGQDGTQKRIYSNGVAMYYELNGATTMHIPPNLARDGNPGGTIVRPPNAPALVTLTGDNAGNKNKGG